MKRGQTNAREGKKRNEMYFFNRLGEWHEKKVAGLNLTQTSEEENTSRAPHKRLKASVWCA